MSQNGRTKCDWYVFQNKLMHEGTPVWTVAHVFITGHSCYFLRLKTYTKRLVCPSAGHAIITITSNCAYTDIPHTQIILLIWISTTMSDIWALLKRPHMNAWLDVLCFKDESSYGKSLSGFKEWTQTSSLSDEYFYEEKLCCIDDDFRRLKSKQAIFRERCDTWIVLKFRLHYTNFDGFSVHI